LQRHGGCYGATDARSYFDVQFLEKVIRVEPRELRLKGIRVGQ
jgi:hypothetical protein